MSEEVEIDKLEKLINRCNECKFATCENCEINWTEVQAINGLLDLYQQEKEKNKELETQRQKGTLSDGYHTYNDLYYQRCILFATLCNLNKNISWKSKKHNDGKKCFDSDEWFIVGIDTPEGTYTYHYEIKYWDLFTVQELEKGKEWDGHTEKDVTRLFSLTNNNINKDKIRAKIESYKSYEHLEMFEKFNYGEIIQVLEELLEEN